MTEQKKYIDKEVLQSLLTKIVNRNDARYLAKAAEAASAAKVKNALTVNGKTFDGSAAVDLGNLSAEGHKHTASDITDFTDAVQKVITNAGGSTHTHGNLGVLETITSGKTSAWDAKIGVDDVAKLKYSNAGMTSVADVKGALDVLVKNVQIGNVALADATANVNGLATRLTQAEKDVDALETAVGNADSGLVKKVADLENANKEGGAVANAIKDAKDAAVAAQTSADEAKAAVAAEKTRAEGKEAELQGAIDTINNASTGILAQAKAYADQQDNVLDGKITAAKSAADAAQGDVDALEGVVGSATDGAEATTVFGKIAKAQAQADKGVADAAAEKTRAKGVEAELRTDLGEKGAAADADGSAFARIAKLKTDLGDEVTRATGIEQGLRTDVDANKTAIETLNGDGEGSVNKKIQTAIEQVNTAAGNLENRVKANEDAIEVINGTGDGSIKKAVADLVNGAPEAMDTLKELADSITKHQTAYQAYVAQVAKDIAAAKQEAITTAGTNADTKDEALHNTITTEIATAKTEAIADAASKDTALENKLQAKIDDKVDKDVYDAKVAELAQADTNNLAAAKKYADDEDAKIEAVIGTADDLATANTLYGKIKALQEKDAAQDTEIGKKAAATDLDALEALVGRKTDGKDADTAFGKIAAEAARADAAEKALGGRIDTADSKIAALETKVGDAESGLVKDVADLKTTVGDASAGLVKDVADLKAKDTTLDAEITALKAKDESLQGSITTNAGNIATLQGDMTDAKATIEGHGTAITALQQWQNNHGEISESELDAMLDAAYGVTQA